MEEALGRPNPPGLVLYVRTPSKLPPTFASNSHVSIVVGNLADFDKISSAMRDHSVTTVVSFLGAYVSLYAIVTRSTDTPIADSFPEIIRAMKANGIRRLLVLSTLSYWVEERDTPTWKLSIIGTVPKIFVPQGNAEMVRIAETVNANGTDLEWTIFRVPHLTDGPADLPVGAGYAGPDQKGGLNLSRRSLARWVLGEIGDREWIRGVPFLGNY